MHPAASICVPRLIVPGSVPQIRAPHWSWGRVRRGHPFLNAPKTPIQKPREVLQFLWPWCSNFLSDLTPPYEKGRMHRHHVQVCDSTSRWRQRKPPKCWRWGSQDGYTHSQRVKTPELPDQAGVWDERAVRRDGTGTIPRGTGPSCHLWHHLPQLASRKADCQKDGLTVEPDLGPTLPSA